MLSKESVSVEFFSFGSDFFVCCILLNYVQFENNFLINVEFNLSFLDCYLLLEV